MRKIILLIFCLLFIIPSITLGKLGVGVGSGKIIIDDKLKPGIIYKLPDFVVLNTGDEEADYEVVISSHVNQEKRVPPEKWFRFSPKEFHLKAGEVQIVKVKLDLPLKTIPGDYFGYLEAHPIVKAEAGVTQVGIAAAAKLYFTIEPANFLQGIFYKLISFWKVYAPWTHRVAIAFGVVILIVLFRKFFKLNIGIKKSDIKDKKDKDE